MRRFSLALLMGVLTLYALTAVGGISSAARQYRATLTRAAHARLGLDAPIATLAAQVQQESAWRPRVESGAGAQGLAQFMPATARWMGQLYAGLRPVQVFNPGWALRAMVAYDRWNYQRITAHPNCDRWAMTLAAYNGGLGWAYRDQRLAERKGFNRQRWWDNVAEVNAGRSAANWHENRDYARRILRYWEPQYVDAGWGRGVCEAGDHARDEQ